MSNEFNPNFSSDMTDLELENGTTVRLGADGIYRPIVETESTGRYTVEESESGYQPRGATKASKHNRPPKSKPTKFVIGTMVVGMAVLPPVAHIVTEYRTDEAIGAVMPGDDEPLGPGDLFHDLGKTFDELTLKNVRNMLGGE
jgi:hypothetical protein